MVKSKETLRRENDQFGETILRLDNKINELITDIQALLDIINYLLNDNKNLLEITQNILKNYANGGK